MSNPQTQPPTLSSYLEATWSLITHGKTEATLSLLKSVLPKSHVIFTDPKNVSYNFVVGNQAGDADTCISSILLGYILQLEQLDKETSSSSLSVINIPVLSFSFKDLRLKPDTLILLAMAEIETNDGNTKLLHLDNPLIISQLTADDDFTLKPFTITLTDHNCFCPSNSVFPNESLQNVLSKVVLILDHHEELSPLAHPHLSDTNKDRFVVSPLGSCCTLVYERMMKISVLSILDVSTKAKLFALLLGVILLDTNNLSVESGKTTERDQVAVDELMNISNWEDEGEKIIIPVGLPVVNSLPDTTTFSSLLRDARFSKTFWGSLTCMEMIGLDYKLFKLNGNKGNVSFSSILIPVKQFLSTIETNDDVSNIKTFLKQEKSDILVVMSMVVEEGKSPRREILLLGGDGEPNATLNELGLFLVNSKREAGDFNIVEVENLMAKSIGGRVFNQGNIKGSRKQVAPGVISFLDSLTEQPLHLQLFGPSPSPGLSQSISLMERDLNSLELDPSLSANVDVYGDFNKSSKESYLRLFEQEVAENLGKEDGVFMPSGVMAQCIALLIHNSKDGKEKEDSLFVCHKTSHLLVYEQESYSHLLRIKPRIVDTDSPMSFQDVKPMVDQIQQDGSNGMVILEHPHRELGGEMNSFDDLCRISKLCKESEIPFHLDGARIWEAAGANDGAHSVKDIANLFDSCYVSFYKGLGGIAGAMLLGTPEFCAQARVWLRRFGGNLYTLFPYTVPAWAGFRAKHMQQGSLAVPLSFPEKANKMKRVVRLLSESPCGKLMKFKPPLPEVSLVHVYIHANREECEKAKAKVFAETNVYVYSRLRTGEDDPIQYFEWNMGDVNGRIDDSVYVDCWERFVCAVQENRKGTN